MYDSITQLVSNIGVGGWVPPLPYGSFFFSFDLDLLGENEASAS
jgi:hypothetical protein